MYQIHIRIFKWLQLQSIITNIVKCPIYYLCLLVKLVKALFFFLVYLLRCWSSERWPTLFNAWNSLISNWWHHIGKFIWISVLFCFSLFLLHTLFSPAVLFHYCCYLLLCLACLLLLITVLYSPLFFLPCICFALCSVSICVLNANKRNTHLFPIPVFSLSSGVLS